MIIAIPEYGNSLLVTVQDRPDSVRWSSHYHLIADSERRPQAMLTRLQYKFEIFLIEILSTLMRTS